MVSITNVTGGQAQHYYQKDDYYTKSQGVWQGEGAERLGLVGEVKKEDFEKLLHGKAPGGQFEIQNGGEGQNHRAGVDLTFSAPKSVSIAAEVLGDDRIKEAHEKAVTEALRYVEQHYAQARQTENNVTERVDTNNLVIAKFQHNLSRELDPQLHTHAVVLNITQREDGQWRALSNEALYKNKMLIGQVYRSELAKNLKELGYSIQSDNRGLFELKGIDEKLIEHFSQRSEQIEAKIKELKENNLYQNTSEAKLREIATLGSRVAKQSVDMSTVREAWQDRLQELGYSKEDIQQALQQAKTSEIAIEANRTEARLNEYDYVRIATQTLTERESVFTREDVLRTAMKLSVSEYRVNDIERAFNELNKDREIIQLSKNAYTTAEMQRIEKSIIDKVLAGHDSKEAIATREQVDSFIKAYEQSKNITLTQSQKNAVNHILTSQDRHVGIQGDAGTGKTTMLAVVHEQAKNAGYEVQGLAFTGKAASEIETQAGIKSQTIDSFLASKDNIANDKQQIWIVDEASMLSSRKMSELLQRAEKADARVVFVGDTKQLQAIEAGRMFAKLQETNVLNTVRMSEIQRQQEADYKEIVKHVSEKQIDKAFQKLEDKNRIVEISDRAERLNAIAKDYTSRENYKDTIIVTARNADKNELNQLIRDELKQQGKLSNKEYTFTVRESKNLSTEDKRFAQSYKENDILIATRPGGYGKAGAELRVISVDYDNHKLTVKTTSGTEHQIDLRTQAQNFSVFSEKQQAFAQNDKVVFLKNDAGMRLKNGQVGEIKSITNDGKVVIQTEAGQEKIINLNTQYNYISHGYAVTDYKSQGQTAKNVIYHADTGKEVNYNQAYVAITRGKEDIKVYTNDKEALKEQMKHEQHKTSVLDYKTVKNELANELRDERKALLQVDIQIAKAKENAQDTRELEQKRAEIQERINTLKDAQHALRAEKQQQQKETQNQKTNNSQKTELKTKSGAYFRVQRAADKDIQKQQKEYMKYQSMLKDKHYQKLQQDANTSDIRKMRGLRSFVLPTKTQYDQINKKFSIKQEVDIQTAITTRLKDFVKSVIYNNTARLVTAGKKDYKTQVKEVLVRNERTGKVERAMQIQRVETHTSTKTPQNYRSAEIITYHKDGTIHIYQHRTDLQSGVSVETTKTLNPRELKIERISKDEYKHAKRIEKQISQYEKERETLKRKHETHETLEKQKHETHEKQLHETEKQLHETSEKHRNDSEKTHETQKSEKLHDSKSHDTKSHDLKDSKHESKEHSKSDDSKHEHSKSEISKSHEHSKSDSSHSKSDSSRGLEMSK